MKGAARLLVVSVFGSLFTVLGIAIGAAFFPTEKIVEVEKEQKQICFKGSMYFQTAVLEDGGLIMIGESIFCGKDLKISNIYGPELPSTNPDDLTMSEIEALPFDSRSQNGGASP